MKNNKGRSGANYIIMIGFCAGVIYWIVDSIIDAFFYRGTSIFNELFTPSEHEFFMRMTVLAVLLAFSIFLRFIVKKIKVSKAAVDDLVKERTSEIVKLNQYLVEMAQEAALAARARSDFIRNVSHELRTPLNSILGFAQILETEYPGRLNEKQKEYLKDINDSGWHLLKLIDNVINISKIDTGKLELYPGKVELKNVFGVAMTLSKTKAQEHSIRYELKTSADLPETIEGDESKIMQVLTHIISNAFKFTPDGGEITVSAKKNDHEIEISVIDGGPGIRNEDRDKLFIPFTKLDKVKSGAGLGLSLSKKLVDLWGGKIGVVSPPESRVKGCRFYFTIPIQA